MADDDEGAADAPKAPDEQAPTEQAAAKKVDKGKNAKSKGAGKQDAKGKPGKGKAGKGKAGKKGAGNATDGAPLPSVANHPRAAPQVGRAKAWGGLAGFGLAALLSWRAQVPMGDLLLRAIVGGVVGYVLAWASAVTLWRHLVIAELRAVRLHRTATLAKLAAAAQSESSAGSQSPRG
jgi:hypothetical protein